MAPISRRRVCALSKPHFLPLSAARSSPWTTRRPTKPGAFSGGGRSRIAEQILLPQPEEYERFFEALEEIERAAGSIPLRFVLIPSEFQVEDAIWEGALRNAGQLLDRDLPQRRIAEWFEARGRPVLDLLQLLRAAEPMEDGRRHLYHLNNGHFNARGNEIAGLALARFLEPLPARSLPIHLDIDRSVSPGVMQSGWHAIESFEGESYVWSDGPRSVLSIRLPKRGDIRMDLDCMPSFSLTAHSKVLRSFSTER